ncbi:zinc finger MYM-type protein 1-like, partial [Aphis craccivora]
MEVEVINSILHNEVQNDTHREGNSVDVFNEVRAESGAKKGKSNEAAYTLKDENLDHGIFLEIITLLGKYDSTLKSHLDTVINNSRKSYDHAINQLIKFKISSEVNKAGIYSVQLDTTQDISTVDQCSVILRYMKNASVQEQ